MAFVFAPKPQAAVMVAGGGPDFPVHRIYCVGRNYAAHAIEMGDTGREAPFFFMKPADAVLPVADGATGAMPYPALTRDLQHEVELVVAIGKDGANIAVEDAESYIWGYAIGLDMTRRDLQAQAKKQGRPWCTAKGFDFSAPVGPIHRVAATGILGCGEVALRVNGTLRQHGDIEQMIWSVNETISALSQFYDLKAGDLIYSGTPDGVAAVVTGDVMEATIAGLGSLKVELV